MAFDFLKKLFAAKELDDDFYEELEENLIMADVGMAASEEIVADLRQRAKDKRVSSEAECRQLLKSSMKNQFMRYPASYPWEDDKCILLVVGVNGVGKTTTIGKLAYSLKNQGKQLMMIAADTFRAGAAEQLKEWASRTDTEIVSQKEGSDPAAVLFDGLAAGKARGAQVLLCDTAGRLHNKKNLMDELKKMHRVVERDAGGYDTYTLLVLDATTGQNALNQAKQFTEATSVDGLILTKMDGTAKGGIAMAVQRELGVPICYVGVGEKIGDLKKFNADEYLNKMLDL